MDRYSIMDFRPRNLLRYRYKGLGPEHNRNTTLCMRTKASSIGLFPLFY